jgi:hypothetical protein
MKTIEAFLREKIGLNCAAIGPAGVERIIRQRMKLSPEGLLFVGPAEQPVALDCGFVSAQLPSSFIWRPTIMKRWRNWRSWPIRMEMRRVRVISTAEFSDCYRICR